MCGDYLVCFHTNVPHGWLFLHVKVHCLLGQGHYFCVHSGCHHVLKVNYFRIYFFMMVVMMLFMVIMMVSTKFFFICGLLVSS
jgi:hypothetical protein